jgi:hypothetical protein
MAIPIIRAEENYEMLRTTTIGNQRKLPQKPLGAQKSWET